MLEDIQNLYKDGVYSKEDVKLAYIRGWITKEQYEDIIKPKNDKVVQHE